MSSTRIFFARAVKPDVDLELVRFFGIIIDLIQILSGPSVFLCELDVTGLPLNRKIFSTENPEKKWKAKSPVQKFPN
jgi:hypothetical protein